MLRRRNFLTWISGLLGIGSAGVSVWDDAQRQPRRRLSETTFVKRDWVVRQNFANTAIRLMDERVYFSECTFTNCEFIGRGGWFNSCLLEDSFGVSKPARFDMCHVIARKRLPKVCCDLEGSIVENCLFDGEGAVSFGTLRIGSGGEFRTGKIQHVSG